MSACHVRAAMSPPMNRLQIVVHMSSTSSDPPMKRRATESESESATRTASLRVAKRDGTDSDLESHAPEEAPQEAPQET